MRCPGEYSIRISLYSRAMRGLRSSPNKHEKTQLSSSPSGNPRRSAQHQLRRAISPATTKLHRHPRRRHGLRRRPAPRRLHPTPAINRMAQQGILATSYYSPANLCTPSRAGLLTGRYPIRTGLAYEVIQPGDDRGLPLSEKTIPDALKPTYVSGLFGKWHLGQTGPDWLPTHHGFDTYYGIPYSHDMLPLAVYEADAKNSDVKTIPTRLPQPPATVLRPRRTVHRAEPQPSLLRRTRSQRAPSPRVSQQQIQRNLQRPQAPTATSSPRSTPSSAVSSTN